VREEGCLPAIICFRGNLLMGEGNCSFSDPEWSALEMTGLESKTSRKNPPYNLTVNME